MTPTPSPDPRRLASRLRLLLDAEATRSGGAEPTYAHVAHFVERHGASLSRSRWQYMLAGTRGVTDVALLTAIAKYFDVDPAFLLDTESEAVPEKVDAQLDLIRALRAREVRTFATRALGDVSPETLEAITRFLDEEGNS